MTDLVVRRLLVDLDAPFARRWAGGDAFRSAFFDALSMSFPVGEQFFIDALKRGLAALPPERRAAIEPEVRGFIGQEATHRRIHERFNAQLEAQGLVNTWAPRSARRLRRLDGLDARHWVAATAATEHFTAVFAQWLLAEPELLDGAEPRLAALWRWHASEELEHRGTAFDLYLALGGDLRWRRRWMRIVTWHFALDLARQTLRNLARDGALAQPATWRSGWRVVRTMLRHVRPAWKRWFDADFHPREADEAPARAWLAANAALAPPVAAPRVDA